MLDVMAARNPFATIEIIMPITNTMVIQLNFDSSEMLPYNDFPSQDESNNP
jgi:hypothetical protein